MYATLESMNKYAPTIGLEIHAELKTKTKMFCNSKNDPDEARPNVNICPVCMGHPGTLPVINKVAVKNVIKVGLSLGGTIADYTEFDRKNYFYPDIPKGYQISQYKFPLVQGGVLAGVALTRIHLEEDTATSLHAPERSDLKSEKRSDLVDCSLIDYNRAGVPLMELVTEPVIKSAEEASTFAHELQLLLRYLGVSDANMEKGEMRVEANISVRPAPDVEAAFAAGSVGTSTMETKSQRKDNVGTGALGTKVEVKNLNSFRAVERAIRYEIDRQSALLERGEKVIQETRGWDENKGVTFSQRLKEESHDYRYFPDPDLPKLIISEIQEFTPELLTKEIPELPWQKRERYKKNFGLKAEDIEVYVSSPALASFFEESVKSLPSKNYALASNYVVSDMIGAMKNNPSLSLPLPVHFAELIELAHKKEISSRGAKDILLSILIKSSSPRAIAEGKGLFQKSNETELTQIASTILAANPRVVEDYRKGKESSLQYFVGQGMKATKGSANPQLLSAIFKKLLQQ